MSSILYTVFAVISFILLSWILFGFKLTLLLFVLAILSVLLLVEGREWTGSLPVNVESLVKPVAVAARDFKLTTKYIGTRIYRSTYTRAIIMFDSWNPLQWLWKGGEAKKPSGSGTRSKFLRRPKSSQSKKQKENPLNLTTPISKSTPKSPRKNFAANRTFDDPNCSISVLNASGPLLSSPMMPHIKRAVANNTSQNDTFSPDYGSTSVSRNRPVRRANTFHFTPTHPVDSSPGVLPWVRFGRRDRHSLYRADPSTLKRHNTVRVAPPDPHRVNSPSTMMPLRERTENTPQPVDTQAVVNALRERRKRGSVAMEEETFCEEVGQHAKRRRQESSQSTASSASLPPMPEQLPDLSDHNVMMQLDQVSLKRPPAPSREAFEESELDMSHAKRQKNTRNNPISSSLSSSKKILNKERTEAKRKAQQLETESDTTMSKRKPRELTPVLDEEFLIQQPDEDLSISLAKNGTQPEDSKGETSAPKSQTTTPGSQSSTPNKRMQMEGISKPTRRRNMSLYPGLNTSFAGVPLARVSATAEDYELDREAERQRVKDMLEDVESSIKKGNKPGSGLLGPASTSASSTATSQPAASVPSIPSLTPASVSGISSLTQTSTTTSISASLTSKTLSNPLLPAATAQLSTASASTPASTAYSFKPVFGSSTSTASSSGGTSTTPSVQSPVSSTTLTGFNPIFPPVSTAVASSTVAGTPGLMASGLTSTPGLSAGAGLAPASSAGLTGGSAGPSSGLASGLAVSKEGSLTSSLGFNVAQGTTSASTLLSAPTSSVAGSLGIKPLSASTPKPSLQTGFSLGGSGLQFGTPGTTAQTTQAQTGASGAPGFQFGQNPLLSSNNSGQNPLLSSNNSGQNPLLSSNNSGQNPLLSSNNSGQNPLLSANSLGSFGAGGPLLPSYSQATSQTTGQTSGTPSLPSNTQAGGNSAPARTLFATSTAPASTTASSGGLFAFGQTAQSAASTATPSTGLQFGQSITSTSSNPLQFGQTATTSASNSFQFGQTNNQTSTVAPQSSAFAFGKPQQSTPQTQAASSTTAGQFTFGATTPAKPATPAFGSTGTPTPGFGTGTAPTGFGTGNTATGFGTGTGSSNSFGSGTTTTGFGAGTAPAPTGFGTGTASSGFGTGTASTTGFGAGTAAPAFGSGTATGFGPSTTGQTAAATSGFSFGSTSTTKQGSFGSTTSNPAPAFGSTQSGSTAPAFGTAAKPQDQKPNVFGAPAAQTGFNFGVSSNSFSAGSNQSFGQSSNQASGFGGTSGQSGSTGAFQFGQTSQQGSGETKGFNFNASFTGTPNVSFGTPSTPAQPSFGTPNSNMFSAGSGSAPAKPRVARRGAQRRGQRR